MVGPGGGGIWGISMIWDFVEIFKTDLRILIKFQMKVKSNMNHVISYVFSTILLLFALYTVRLLDSNGSTNKSISLHVFAPWRRRSGIRVPCVKNSRNVENCCRRRCRHTRNTRIRLGMRWWFMKVTDVLGRISVSSIVFCPGGPRPNKAWFFFRMIYPKDSRSYQ